MRRQSEAADKHMWTGLYDQAFDLWGANAAAEMIGNAQLSDDPLSVIVAIKKAQAQT